MKMYLQILFVTTLIVACGKNEVKAPVADISAVEQKVEIVEPAKRKDLYSFKDFGSHNDEKYRFIEIEGSNKEAVSIEASDSEHWCSLFFTNERYPEVFNKFWVEAKEIIYGESLDLQPSQDPLRKLSDGTWVTNKESYKTNFNLKFYDDSSISFFNTSEKWSAFRKKWAEVCMTEGFVTNIKRN